MRPASELVDSGSEWYDTRPSYWQLARLNHVATTWPSNVDKHTVPNQPAVRLCNYVDVYKNDEIDENIEFMRATATPDQVERFRLKVGDTLLTKDSETADDIGIPAFVSYEAADLVCGYHLSIVRPRVEAVFPRYLFWALGSMPVFDQWAVLASGVTRVGIRAGDLAKAAILLPPMDEQRAIADFLDRETARIDTLIEEQQRLIDLLRERRQSEIDVSFEPDERWTRTSLKHCLDGVDQGVSPQAEAGLADTPGSWGVLKSGCVNRGVFRQEEHKRLADDFAVNIALAISDGDLIVSRASGSPDLVGSAAIVGKIDYNLILSDKLFRLRPSQSTSSVYLYWFLNSRHYRMQVRRAISGADGLANNLPLSALRNFEMAIPTLNEQRRIAASLDEKTSAIDAVVVEAEKFIELVRERRAALITAAVTGQIDVRDEVA